MLDLLISIGLGIIFGIFTGLIPGIHVNLISLILLSVSPILLDYASPLALCSFIISMATTHSFIDFIPSTFLGAPDPDTALNVLPAHRMLMEGRAFSAVLLTMIGSLGALLLSIALVPLMMFLVRIIYPLLKSRIGWILLILMLFMIFRDEKRWKNLFVFVLAGVLGLSVLSISWLKDPLFPMLSGLFGTSLLLVSLFGETSIPPQKIIPHIDVKKMTVTKALLSSTFAGSLTAFFPGLGAAQGAVIAQQLNRDLEEKGFMILVGGINTVNFVLSLVTLYTIDKARNGAVIAVAELVPDVSLAALGIFAAAALLSGSLATIVGLRISRVFSRLMGRVNYKVMVKSVISFVVILVFWFSGPLGLLVLLVSTAVGILAGQLGVAKNHLMACLILPVILYFVL